MGKAFAAEAGSIWNNREYDTDDEEDDEENEEDEDEENNYEQMEG